MKPNPVGPDLSAAELVVGYGKRRGSGAALNGFTARFGPGITGLIGPNGAGKTTFLRSVAGLLRPCSGQIEVRGMAPAAFLAAEGIGFLPESPALPSFLTVGEFFRGIVPRTTAPREEGGEAGWLGLPDLGEKRLDALSLGQRKKVALRAALLGDPPLVLLDEPTNGLDPLAVRELRDTLQAQKARGITLIISSHNLDELQRVADSLVFVQEGSVIGAWSRDRALERFGTLEALFDHSFSEV